MNNIKGFAPTVIIILIILVGGIGGVAYYAGKSSRITEDKLSANSQKTTTALSQQVNYQPTTPKPINNLPSQRLQMASCLVITYPVINQTLSFPLTITGYIDVVGAKAGTCTKWSLFENDAGAVFVKDTNGNTKSAEAQMKIDVDYSIGIKRLPFSATISKLTGVPYLNDVSLHFGDNDPSGGAAGNTLILQPFTVTPYL